MPHATMERRHQPGVGSGGQGMYYTLQPSSTSSRSHVANQDNYGSLPSQGSVNIQNYGAGNYSTLPSQHRNMNQPENYGTAPRNGGPLPSYNNFNSLPRQSGGYNSLPPQQGNYGTLPTHHEYKSQTLPHPPRDVRQLPAPSLSRHTVKVLQVPILVVGGEGDLSSKAYPVPSPSPSHSTSSTISDPPAAPSPTTFRAQGMPAQKPVQHRPGYVHPNSQHQPQPRHDTSQSHGFSTASLGPQTKVHNQPGPVHDYTNMGTWPHARVSHNHIQHPSPSPSPSSSSNFSTLPHQHTAVHQPPRASPVPSPVPQPVRTNANATVLVHAPPPTSNPPAYHQHHHHHHPNHAASTSSIPQQLSQPLSNQIVATNGQSSTPSPKSFNNDNVIAQSHTSGDDFSQKIREMQSDMERMQKQMEEQFRSMQMGGPTGTIGKSGFPDFPPLMTPPFGSLPGSMDTLHSQSSLNNPPTPSIMDPNFGTMMSNDMSMGGPLLDETDGKGGKKQLKLNLDMHDFQPEEVKVKSDKNRLEVTAHHEEKDPNRVTCRVFHQQYHLPPNVRMAKMKYDMTPTGELKVEGTVKPRHRVKWAEDTLTK